MVVAFRYMAYAISGRGKEGGGGVKVRIAERRHDYRIVWE